MANITMQAQPSQYGQPFNTEDGTQYTVGPTGLIAFPANFINNGLRAGFSVIPGTTAKVVTNPAVGSQTANAGDLSGATDVTTIYTGINGGTLTTRTAAQMYTDAGSPAIGSSFNLRIMCPVTSGLGLTIAAGAGVTITGRQSVPANGQIDYVVTWTSATTCTFQIASFP